MSYGIVATTVPELNDQKEVNQGRKKKEDLEL